MTKEQSQILALKSAIASARLEDRIISTRLEMEILETLKNPLRRGEQVQNWLDEMKKIPAYTEKMA